MNSSGMIPRQWVMHIKWYCLLQTFPILADRCRSTTDLLQSNEETFGYLEEYLLIKNRFARFDFHCQVNAPLRLRSVNCADHEFRDFITTETISRRWYNSKLHFRSARFRRRCPIWYVSSTCSGNIDCLSTKSIHRSSDSSLTHAQLSTLNSLLTRDSSSLPFVNDSRKCTLTAMCIALCMKPSRSYSRLFSMNDNSRLRLRQNKALEEEVSLS